MIFTAYHSIWADKDLQRRIPPNYGNEREGDAKPTTTYLGRSKIFLFSTVPRKALRPTKPLIQ
jgi:hypothetical protein